MLLLSFSVIKKKAMAGIVVKTVNSNRGIFLTKVDLNGLLE
jgi:hypothetical protein